MASAQKLIAQAVKYIGYLEKKSNSQLDSFTANAGSGNWTRFGRDYGLNPAQWCGIFVSQMFVEAFGKETAKKLLIDTTTAVSVSSDCEKIGVDPDELGLISKIEIDPEVELPADYGERTRLSVAYSQTSPILWAKMKQQEEIINQLQKTVEKLVETVGGEAVWQ